MSAGREHGTVIAWSEHTGAGIFSARSVLEDTRRGREHKGIPCTVTIGDVSARPVWSTGSGMFFETASPGGRREPEGKRR